ncbi:MAG: hypothetical protein PHW04_16125 [Candidatus Wallbacteria bacterium]|nr:hypothetical protein [Candidatus Wallbacteria bacterium]
MRRIHLNQVREILYRLRKKVEISKIADEMGFSRNTEPYRNRVYTFDKKDGVMSFPNSLPKPRLVPSAGDQFLDHAIRLIRQESQTVANFGMKPLKKKPPVYKKPQS